MQRYGQIIGVRPEQIATYEDIHTRVWPEVLTKIAACHMHNYTIFRYGNLLFAYFEYNGDDFDADMLKMSTDPKTREWWTHTDPMQDPMPDRPDGAWWTTMREVFHSD